MKQVFISYAESDELAAAELNEALTGRGADVFFAPASIKPGDLWVERISERLGTSDLAVVLWSSASLKSDWVRQEVWTLLARSVRRQVSFIGVLLEDVEVPALASSFQHVSAFPMWDAEAVANRILGGPRPSRTVQADRLPVRLGDLDNAAVRLIAERLLAEATELGSGLRPAILFVELGQDRRFGAALIIANLLLPGELSAFEDNIGAIRDLDENLRNHETGRDDGFNPAAAWDRLIARTSKRLGQEYGSLRQRLASYFDYQWTNRIA